MNRFDVLMIVSCMTSTVTMVIVLISIFPRIKRLLLIVRDAVLWLALIAVLVGIGWIGWSRLATTRQSNASSSESAGQETTAVTHYYRDP